MVNTLGEIETDLIGGIHTLSIDTNTLAPNNIIGVGNTRAYVNNATGELRYIIKINPSYNLNANITSYSSFIRQFNLILNSLGIDNYKLSRVDFSIDSYDDNYNTIYKMNRLLVLMFATKYYWKNRYECVEPLCFDRLTIKAQNDHFEVENYNKDIRSNSKDQAKNRLEFRSKRLIRINKDIPQLANDWQQKLINLPDYFNTHMHKTNKALFDLWLKEEGKQVKSISEFVRKYQICIYSTSQLKEFLSLLGYSSKPDAISKLKSRNNLDILSSNDFEFYIKKVVSANVKYMTT